MLGSFKSVKDGRINFRFTFFSLKTSAAEGDSNSTSQGSAEGYVRCPHSPKPLRHRAVSPLPLARPAAAGVRSAFPAKPSQAWTTGDSPAGPLLAARRTGAKL